MREGRLRDLRLDRAARPLLQVGERPDDLQSNGVAQRVEHVGQIDLLQTRVMQRPHPVKGSNRTESSNPSIATDVGRDQSLRFDPGARCDCRSVWHTLASVAKQRQTKMQYAAGSLGAVQMLEARTDEQLLRETKHRAAARALLGARAAERYDAKQARAYFNEALVGVHPRERPMLRQMMKASLAQAERRPDELREAMQKLGQEPPSNRQLMLLRLMGLIAPPPNASVWLRVRGFAILILLVVLLVAVGFGLAN